MTELWSSNYDAYSHRCRIVVCEKDLSVERGVGIKVCYVDTNSKSEDLARISPKNEVPMMIERDLQLYDANIINEYLDERFPHPQLMPLSVTEKGRVRLLLHEFDRELYARMDIILATKPSKKLDLQRKLLGESLLRLKTVMSRDKYFLGNEFTMVDVALAPILWRIEYLGVKLPPKAVPLLKYAETIFSRESFIKSLTPTEKEMRK